MIEASEISEELEGEGHLLIVREDRIERVRDAVMLALNKLYDEEKVRFNQAEMVLAFNEIVKAQRDADNYLATMT